MSTTYQELKELPFEPSPETLEAVKRIDAERDQLRERLNDLAVERQAAINAEAQSRAVLKAGDRVRTVHRRKTVDAEISSVNGQLFQLEHLTRVIINYEGHPLKADGSFGDRKSLHSIKVPAAAQEVQS